MANLKNGSTIGGKIIESQQGAQLKSDKAYTDAKAYVDAHIGKGGTVHAEATQSSAGFISAGDKTKLDNIASNATKVEDSTTNGNIKINGAESVVYTHPGTHAATMITQDTNNRFVSDAEKATWNAKLSTTDNAASATKLQTSRTISLTGDVTGSVSFDGSSNASITTSYKNSGVTAGTYKSVTVDAKGNVTAGTNPTTLSGYGITDAAASNHTHSIASSAITDVVVTSPTDNEVLAYDTSTAKWINQTAAEAGLLTTSGTAAAATKWATGRTLTLSGDVTGTSAAFDGTGNITITTAIADDSHNHTIANIDGLQTALDGKQVAGSYLTTSGKAADSDKVDGLHASSFMRSDADDSFSGKHIASARQAGIYGTYDSTKIDHVWSMGSGYVVEAAGANFGNLYGMAYKHTNNTSGGTMAGGHQIVFASNGTPGAAIGLAGNIWTSGVIYEGGVLLSNKYVSQGTTITTSTGLTGGGPLATNRTLALDLTYTDGRYLNKTGDTLSGTLNVGTSSAGQTLNAYGYLKSYCSDGKALQLYGTDHAYVEFYGKGWSGARTSFIGHGSPTIDYFQVRNDVGYILLGAYGTGTELALGQDSGGPRIWSLALYDRTYSGAANMYVTSAGTVGRSTSASKYKLSIEDKDVANAYSILNIKPKTWYDKAASEQYAGLLSRESAGEEIDWDSEDVPMMERISGLIAEDVIAAGFPEYVIYGDKKEDGTREVEGLQYDRLWTMLLPIVKEQQAKIQELEERINALTV